MKSITMLTNKFPNSKRPLYSAAFIVLLDTLSFGLVMPAMPDLLIDLGCTSISEAAFYAGLLSSAFALMQFFFGPLIGNLSDRFGRRPIVLLSIAVLFFDYLIKGISHSLMLLFVGRIISGVVFANYSTACAIVADVSQPKQKAKNFGLLGTALGLGFILGAAISGFLSTANPRMPFFAATFITLGNLIFSFLCTRETLPIEKKRKFAWQQANPLIAFKALSAQRWLSRMMLVFFLYEIAFNVYQATWAFYLKERFGWNVDMVGLSLGIFGLMTALVQGFGIRFILSRLSEFKIAACGLAINAIIFLLYAYASQPWMIFCLLPFSALGTIFVPAVQSILTSFGKGDAHGELQGLVTSVRAVSITTGPPLMATVFSFFTSGNQLYFSGAAFLLAMLISVLSIIILLHGHFSTKNCTKNSIKNSLNEATSMSCGLRKPSTTG